jgi:hypothetical protein
VTKFLYPVTGSTEAVREACERAHIPFARIVESVRTSTRPIERCDGGVTVVSNRTPEEIHSGRVMSSQLMFHSAIRQSVSSRQLSGPPRERRYFLSAAGSHHVA